jgi:hypothetical protein
MKSAIKRQRIMNKFVIYKNIGFNYNESIIHNDRIIVFDEKFSDSFGNYFKASGDITIFSEKNGLASINKNVISLVLKNVNLRMHNQANMFERIISYQILLKIRDIDVDENMIDIFIKEYIFIILALKNIQKMIICLI